MNIREKLTQLNIQLPDPPKPVGAYLPAVQAGNLIVVSGQLPTCDGKLLALGSVPSASSVEKTQSAARQCVFNALAIIDQQLHGDWDRFLSVVRIGVFVNSDDDFFDQAKVANAASELLVEIFGQSGKHARAAVGVNTLPLNASIEMEMMVQVS